jgi:hypothetical protein
MSAGEDDVPRIDPAVIAEQRCDAIIDAVNDLLTVKYTKKKRMVDPVIAADGYTYERTAIEQWFLKGKAISPITGMVLLNQTLIPNIHLRLFNGQIESIYEKYGNNKQDLCDAILTAVQDFFKDQRFTYEFLYDPVVAADGFTYNKDDIDRWIHRGNLISPATGARLPNLTLISNRSLLKFQEKIQSIYINSSSDYNHFLETAEILQKILGEDYDEEQMQRLVGYSFHSSMHDPNSLRDLISRIGIIGHPKYKEFGIIDDEQITRIKKKLAIATAMLGGARKRRTPVTSVKHRKSSRRQSLVRLRRRRRRTNKK